MTPPAQPVKRTRKMDVPVPVYNWLLQIKTDLFIARGHEPTWPDVFDWLMAQHKAADQVKGAGR